MTLSVTATVSSGTLTYQWLKDGVNLSGQTGSTLTINPAASTDTGVYTVLVQSGVVSELSEPMSVEVYVPFDSPTSYDVNFPADMIPGITTSLGQGNFDVITPGYGIWGNYDVFHYSHTAVTGDFDLQEGVAS